MENLDPEQLSFTIIDSRMMVDSMRNSGYKTTGHALAELIDNSIESEATTIEIFGISQRETVRTRQRYRLKELAVLDNGTGMDAITLRGSLRYGHGTRRDRKGIGRFGLGLPNSSMSQARKVDVWSWQSGVTNALHTYLSLDEIDEGIEEVHQPEIKPIPEEYRNSTLNEFGESGTLVVWSDLDRVDWKSAAKTFEHVELLLGRIYRRFIANQTDRLHKNDPRNDEIGEQRTITLIPVSIDEDGARSVEDESIVRVRPNDPLYLMSGTSCPEDFGPGPMFKELEGSPFKFPIEYKGDTHTVLVRASYARRHVRRSDDRDAEWIGRDAGNTPWGKHANSNLGVSVIRAHREIHLDKSWVSGDDPRERWWTIEIDFPTALDDVFGVTNNKQGVTTLERLSEYDWRREALSGEENEGQVRRRMEEDNDVRAYLVDICKQIKLARAAMQNYVRQTGQPRTPGRHDDRSEEEKADARASSVIVDRVEEGYKGTSDKVGEGTSSEEQQKTQIESLITNHKIDREQAFALINAANEAGNRVLWIQSAQPTPAFFSVEPVPNQIQVALNTNHPVYSHLYDILHPQNENLSEADLRDRLDLASAAFRLLIYSWARFEDEQIDSKKATLWKIRSDWGEYAREFFDIDPDDSIDPTDLV